MIGAYTHPEKGLILHTITTVHQTEDGEEVSTTDDNHMGHTLRSAYAPASDPNTIAMSPFWREQAYDHGSMEWVNNIDRPFGEYGFLFQKQQ